MPRWGTWSSVLVLALVVPACSKDKAAAPGPSTTVASTATTTARQWSTGPSEAAGNERGLLVRVTATDEGDTEKVTFEFEGAVPGYRVAYVTPPVVEPASGKEVAVDGDSVLAVSLEPASGFDLSGGGRQVFKGPERLDLATTKITDVVRVGDFEGKVSWAIGIRGGKAGFLVTRHPDTRTITVEVA
jgi:hypothetical protein